MEASLAKAMATLQMELILKKSGAFAHICGTRIQVIVHALEVIIAIRPVVGLFSIVVLLCAVILPFPTPSILEAHGKVVHRGSRSPLSSSDT